MTARCTLGCVLSALLVSSAVSCRHAPGTFVAVDDLPAEQVTETEYRIGPGDTLGIRVWQQDSMSTDRTAVREDGKASVPLLRDVDAAGLTPSQLAAKLEVAFTAYVLRPIVTVTIVAMRPLRVSVVGEVAKPGAYELDHGAGVLHAIAAAGGLTQYAHRDRVYVLRNGCCGPVTRDPGRIRFSYDALARAEGRGGAFQVRAGDVVVVE